MDNNLNKVFLTYGGCDVVLFFNNMIFGELQRFTYDESIKQLELTFINFSTSSELIKEPKQWHVKEKVSNFNNILIEQVSKAENSASYISNVRYKAFTNVNFLYEKGGMDVDDILEETTFVCNFDKVLGAYDLPYDENKSIQELLKETRNFLNIN